MAEDYSATDERPGKLNLVAQCRTYHLPFWQCPQVLFIMMGIVTIVAIVSFYVVAIAEQYDPHLIALISTLLAGFFMTQIFIIMQAFERMADANRIQVDFMNIAIHQLRSPVTAARWAMDRITTEATSGLSTETLQELYIVRDSVVKIAHLVSSILGIVRIEAGTVAKRMEIFSVNEMVIKMVETTRWYARAANLDLVADIPKETLFVNAEREQIYFVLDHLVDNALRYSRTAGSIHIQLETEGSMAKVTVLDTGEGIPGDDQKQIFEKFFRGTNANALQPGGAGLSLFVARTIIESYHGKMGFASDEGEGSRFWFTLPTHRQKQDS